MTESEYSNCSECYNYSINNYIYENDKKKCLELKLKPDEYKKQKKYLNCSICQNLLCLTHGKRALKNHKYYRFYLGYMCDNCCWNEIG